MGTVELTGLEMMFSRAPGQASAAAATRSRTMPRGCEQEWAGGLGRLTEARQAHSCSARPPAPFKPRPDRKCALAGVDLEQVVARHARLARHARGDDDDVAPLEGGVQFVGAGVALGVEGGWGGGGVGSGHRPPRRPPAPRAAAGVRARLPPSQNPVSRPPTPSSAPQPPPRPPHCPQPLPPCLDDGARVDVRQVGRDAGRARDIVQRQLRDVGVDLMGGLTAVGGGGLGGGEWRRT